MGLRVVGVYFGSLKVKLLSRDAFVKLLFEPFSFKLCLANSIVRSLTDYLQSNYYRSILVNSIVLAVVDQDLVSILSTILSFNFVRIYYIFSSLYSETERGVYDVNFTKCLVYLATLYESSGPSFSKYGLLIFPRFNCTTLLLTAGIVINYAARELVLIFLK